MLKIINVPNKALTATAKPVHKIDSRIRRLIADMEKLLLVQQDPPGVGLAASQVGIPLRLFIIKATPKAKTDVFINPKIMKGDTVILGSETTPESGKRDSGQARMTLVGQAAAHKSSVKTKLEGCLSIPRIWAPVRRQKTVKLSYLDQHGKEKIASYTSFKAIIIQHEIDHLEGILFTQRALEQSSQIYEEDSEGKLQKME